MKGYPHYSLDNINTLCGKKTTAELQNDLYKVDCPNCFKLGFNQLPSMEKVTVLLNIMNAAQFQYMDSIGEKVSIIIDNMDLESENLFHESIKMNYLKYARATCYIYLRFLISGLIKND